MNETQQMTDEVCGHTKSLFERMDVAFLEDIGLSWFLT